MGQMKEHVKKMSIFFIAGNAALIKVAGPIYTCISRLLKPVVMP